MTERENDLIQDERVEDLDVTSDESEGILGGCQNNLAQATNPVAGRVAKVDALTIKQKVV